MRTWMARILAIFAFLLSAPTPATAGDETQAQIERGQTVFKQCNVCHTFDTSGASGTGPNLYGIVGSKVGRAGKKVGFGYSQALLNTKVTWTPENLDKFLKDPATFAPGTAMPFSGIKDDDDRKALIAFLKAAPKVQSGKEAR
jgi:cytochrome c